MTTAIVTASSATNTYTHTAPAGIYEELIWLTVRYTSDATVGNRQLRMYLLDDAGVEVRDMHPGAVQAASAVMHYDFSGGIYRETAFVDSAIQVPFPIGFIVPAGWKIKIADANNVSAADSMTIAMQYRDVANRE